MRIENYMLRYGSVLTAPKAGQASAKEATEGKGTPQGSFKEVLKQKRQEKELIFSKHAQQRMTQRDIELSQDDLGRLACAVGKAGEKGVDNTLVLCDKGAFIINVPSQTVITALGGSDLKDNIFTQIDGAVIL